MPEETSISNGHVSLSSMSEDVWITILRFLPVRDILAIRQTSTRIYAITSLRTVWHTALITQVIALDLPSPRLEGRPIADLSSAELENVTRSSLTFHENWSCAEPVRRQVRSVKTTAGRVAVLRFLPGRAHRYLMSFGNATQHHSSVQVWRVASGELSCVADWVGPTRVTGLVVNLNPSSPGTIAITVRSQGIKKLQILQFDEDGKTLSLLKEIEDIEPASEIGSVLAMDGQILILGDINGSGIVTLFNWLTDRTVVLSHPGSKDSRCLRAHIIRQAVLVFREWFMELYVISGITGSDDVRELRPVAVHQWQWQVNSVVLSERRCWSVERLGGVEPPYPLISMLFRFDSWVPWPVNAIHHVVLKADPAHAVTGSASSSPYLFPPIPQESMPSSLRLFGPSDMAMSPYGTALWMDSESEGPGVDAPVGERIAARRLSVTRATAGELLVEATGEATTALFGAQAREGWNTLAMDEEAGRIAVGDDQGYLEVWDYL